MISTTESTSTFNAGLGANCSRHPRCMPRPRKVRAFVAAIVPKLRDLAPYALMELVLPGGSVMALLLWLYRRERPHGRDSSKGLPDKLQSLSSDCFACPVGSPNTNGAGHSAVPTHHDVN